MSATSSELLAFYEDKTAAILRRYGPGPRVHYHTGLLEAEITDIAGAIRLRELMVQSQENLLHHAATVWRFESLRGREVLDVGCGLGGGALYLAQEFDARVTALTIVPSHAELVRHFAAQAGVSELVTPIVCDAADVAGEARFDAAIAIDSSSSFARPAWFKRLAKVLRPGGRVLIADCFLENSRYEEPFNFHWYAQIGTLRNYLEAAHEAGFGEETIKDLSRQARNFWSLSLSLMDAEPKSQARDMNSTGRVEASRRMHTMLRDALANGGLRYLLLGLKQT